MRLVLTRLQCGNLAVLFKRDYLFNEQVTGSSQVDAEDHNATRTVSRTHPGQGHATVLIFGRISTGSKPVGHAFPARCPTRATLPKWWCFHAFDDALFFVERYKA